jgi:serine/threonine protein kinase
MAAVYLAYDPNFRRNVAIKLISGNLQENLVFRERFEREAHLIAKIEHPAIVPVYDYGEQEKQLYLVMRHMPGGSLASRIKQGVFTLGHAAQIISQIAPALDAVHAQGIVHRDLKPGNILLDSFGNAAISDFGIAHLSVATTDLTGSAIIGTPSYMSPEQVRGDEDLDGRSDIYAVGVILFEMLTGRGPFQANTPMSVALKHLTEPLPSIRSFRPDLPPAVEQILNKALAKDRNLRHARASDLALELREVSENYPQSGISAPEPLLIPSREDLSTELDLVDESHDDLIKSDVQSKPSGDQAPLADKAVLPGGLAHQSLETETTSRQSPRRKLKFITLSGSVLLILIGCSTVALFGAWIFFGRPGFFTGPSPTSIPTLTVTPENVVFADDFSDPASGWPTLQNTREGYGYQQDGFHIVVHVIDRVSWAKTNREDGNTSIYVDATPVTEGALSYYGLLCRIQDDHNFYYFVIRSNGDYTFGKYKNAEFEPFFDWTQSDAINKGSQTNRLKADCTGNTLRFSVNGVPLGEVTDADFISGFSGILVGALDAGGFEVRFNNYLITKTAQ